MSCIDAASWCWRHAIDLQLRIKQETNTELYRPSLETLRTLIRTSTSSMTSVPKPLKFLHPHYAELQSLYESWKASDDKVCCTREYPITVSQTQRSKSLFADILSVLAMTYSDTQPRGTLRYRLLSASLRPAGSPLTDPGSWGHEYVRHLSAELGEEYSSREFDEAGEETREEPSTTEIPGSVDDLRALAVECASFLLQHNAEPDAVDLLEELEIVDKLVDLVDENTFDRVCLYMIRSVASLSRGSDVELIGLRL